MKGRLRMAPRSKSDIREIGARHAADDDEIAAASAVERREQLADLAPLDPGMRETLDLRRAPRRECRQCADRARGLRRLGHHARKRTASGNDAERAFYRSTRHAGRAPVLSSARRCGIVGHAERALRLGLDEVDDLLDQGIRCRTCARRPRAAPSACLRSRTACDRLGGARGFARAGSLCASARQY